MAAVNENPKDLKPKQAVCRILAAAGVNPPEREAYWLGFHMERFVGYARIHGELLDLPVAVEAYLAFITHTQPIPPDWQLVQIKQALTFFARGTERWQWVKASALPVSSSLKPGPKGWVLRYRVRASGQAVVAVGIPTAAVAAGGAPSEMEAWLLALQKSIRLNHYSLRTEQSYLEAVKRFLLFTGAVAGAELSGAHVKRYLEYLAVERNVAASTQNQAFSALLYFSNGF